MLWIGVGTTWGRDGVFLWIVRELGGDTDGFFWRHSR